MDESLRELVSRHLDGDLDDAESSRLMARAETDSELAFEIETTSELRAAVRAVADRMEPPAALDRVLEPLRQAPPVPSPRARPVFRWLGIAAAVVLGVTVATEMARRNPTPTLSPTPSRQHRPVAERDEVFKLAPLPTAVENDNRPLGAADHLLEEEPALPAVSDPVPLEVIGPLDTAAPEADRAESTAPEDLRSADDAGEFALRQDEAARPAPAKRGAGSGVVGSVELKAESELTRQGIPTDADRPSAAELAVVGKDGQAKAAGEPPKMEVSVVLLIDDVVVWLGSSTSCQAGRWPVRIEVAENAVSAIAPVTAEDKEKQARSCIPDEVIGSPLDGVANGTHLGELIVSDAPK